MPIVVRYLNDSNQECTLRPTPFISVSSNINKLGGGDAIGTTYSITLTGTILESQGFPYARDVNGNLFLGEGSADLSSGGVIVGPYESFDSTVGHSDYYRPPVQVVPWNYKLDAILFKQKVIRALFAKDGQRLEISPVHGDAPAIVCFPRVVGVNFAEGNYVERCEYTINLEADTLLDKDLNVHHDGNPLNLEHDAVYNYDLGVQVDESGLMKTGAILDYKDPSTGNPKPGEFVNAVSEDWSIEVDESRGENLDHPRSYRISHNMNATGKTHYYPDPLDSNNILKKPAWEGARDFVQNRLLPPDTNIASYPNVMTQIGSGTLNLISAYGGYNHVRTEQVGVTEGTYGVTENWLISSGTAYENYSMSISSDLGTPFVTVSLDGTIAGLSAISPSGSDYGGLGPNYGPSGAYDNALLKYHDVSNTGQFGLTSDIYARANRAVAVQLNSQPTSVSLGLNEFNGEITYALAFDNRPLNIISGVLSENISINDTYPGDVMAIIPVIGRATGPVLQYIGGRTEYKRDLSIELVMDYTDIPYDSGRNSLLLMKPSTNEPTRTQLRTLIKELSPEKEPGIRKYFISPPSESWTPKEGRYSFNLSWIYELDK